MEAYLGNGIFFNCKGLFYDFQNVSLRYHLSVYLNQIHFRIYLNIKRM